MTDPLPAGFDSQDAAWMQLALRLARRARGQTSPNPAVGAVLVKNAQVIGQGWHQRAGLPHAEIKALQDAQAKGYSTGGATLYVTLEPCSTHGRMPPCTEAILKAGIRTVIAAAMDPNPRHQGAGFRWLKKKRVRVMTGLFAAAATELNKAFNHWIVHRMPWVTVKAAMTLDGKIATATGQSKWITSARSRAHAMSLRFQADAILVGVRTIIADDPKLTFRHGRKKKLLRRIILDTSARIPLDARVISDEFSRLTTVVALKSAPPKRLTALKKRVTVWIAPSRRGQIDLRWVLRKLGAENVTHLLVEGGGQTNAAFLFGHLANEVAFFYAPKVLGGAKAIKAVAGQGARNLSDSLLLRDLHWRRFGPDLFLSAHVHWNH